METSSLPSESKDRAGTHILALLESINDGFLSMKPDWSCTSINRAAEGILGRQRQEVLGKNFWEVFPEMLGTPFWIQCQGAAEARSSMDIEDSYPPTGQRLAFHISASPIGIALSFHPATPHEQHMQEQYSPDQYAQLQASLMELASDAIIVRDPASRVVSWNRGAEHLYGWSAPEARGKITHQILQTRFPASRQDIDRFLATGERWEGELTHTRKDGTPVIVESRQVVIRNTAHEPVAIMEMNRDITERKQRERENQEQYRTIVRTANEGIWLIDAQAQTLFINERMAQMLGYSIEEMSGHSVPEFVFPEDIAYTREHIGRNLQGVFEQFDFRFRRKDGSPLSVLACTSPVRDGHGAITGALGMFTDVSLRKQAEEARLQLAALVESAAIPIIAKTREGIIVSWNSAAEQMYGYSTQEAVGQPVTIIFPPDRQDEFKRIMERISRGERVDLYETQRQRKDGTILPVSITISPIYNSAGEIVGASDIEHDITERKRIEAQERFLTEVSKVLSSTLDYQETLSNVARLVVPQLADWFAVDLVDAAGNFEMIELAHKDPEQVRWARALRERYPIDPTATTGIPQVARTGESELYAEISDEFLVAMTKNEEELALARQIGYSSAMIVPLLARGKNLGVISFVATESGKRYDQRDLALAEEVGRRAGIALDNAHLYREIRQSRDQLDIILQGVADGIIVYAKDNRVLYANEAAARRSGASSLQDLLATPQESLLDRYELIDERGRPFPRAQLTHWRVFAGEPEARAIIGYREVGTAQPELWSLVTARPVADEHGDVAMVITIIHDITERMQVERRKDEFISMASHELKTPVTSLKGFTNVLQRRLTKQGDEQGLHYLARMDAQLNKLALLINELLDISRMQSGKLPLRAEPLDLDALIEETVENMQAATTTHRLHIEGRTGVQVLGDKDRLGQVFINLLSNAIKYSPEADRVLVRPGQGGDGKYVCIHVQDFGIGIDKSYHKKIFERFYQVNDAEVKTYPGLGIGLYISREIIMRHQGHMWLESRKGEGSTFSVSLPLFQPAEQTSTEKTARERDNQEQPGTARSD